MKPHQSTPEIVLALQILVVLLGLGDGLMFAYHDIQTTAGATICAILAGFCYICAFPTTAWAMGAWLDHREPKKP